MNFHYLDTYEYYDYDFAKFWRLIGISVANTIHLFSDKPRYYYGRNKRKIFPCIIYVL